MKKSGKDITHRRRSLRIDRLESRLLLAADYQITYGPYNYVQPAYGSTAVVGNDLYFWDIEADSGAELHKMNTVTGAVSLVMDINPGIASSHVSDTDKAGFAVVDSYLYFVSYDLAHGEKLRRIDVSQETAQLETIDGPMPQNWDSRLVVVGKKVFFRGDSQLEYHVFPASIYWTDSTETSLKLNSLQLHDSDAGSDIQAGYSSLPDQGLTVYQSRLFFWAADSSGRYAVRWIDTTANNLAMQTLPLRGSPSTFALQVAEGKLFFAQYDNASGSELRWIDLGQEQPQVHAVDIVPGPRGSDAGRSGFAVIDDKLYFAAADEEHGMELRSIDLLSNTSDAKLIELVAGPEDSLRREGGNLVAAGHRLYATLEADSISPQTAWIDTQADDPKLNFIDTNISLDPKQSLLADDKIFTSLYNSQDGLYYLNWIDTKNAPSHVETTDLIVPRGDQLVDVPRFTQYGGAIYFLARNPSKFALWQVDTASMKFHQDYIFVVDGKYNYSGGGSFTGSPDFPQSRFTLNDKSYSTNFDSEGKARLEWFDGKHPEKGFQVLPDVEVAKGLGVVKSKVFFLGKDVDRQDRLYWIDSTLDTPIAHAGGLWPKNVSLNTDYGTRPFVLGDILLLDTTYRTFSMVWFDASQESPTISKLDVPTYGDLSSKPFVVGASVYFTRETSQNDYLLQRIEVVNGQLVVVTLGKIHDSKIIDDPDAPYQDYNNSNSQFSLIDNKLYIATSYSRYGHHWIILDWLDTTLDAPTLHRGVLAQNPIESDGIGIRASFEGKLFFSMGDGKPGNRLFWIDMRSSDSTIHQIDIAYPDGRSGYIAGDITFLHDKAYFMLYNGNRFEFCWIDLASDPAQLHWLNSEEQHIWITYSKLLVIDDRLYFQGEGFSGTTLYWIDTRLDVPVVNSIDIDPDLAIRDQPIDTFYKPSVGSRLYFVGYQAEFGRELMWIDLNETKPTVHTIDIFSGPDDSQPNIILDTDGRLYAFARLNKYIGALVSVETTATPSAITISQDSFDEGSGDRTTITLSSDDEDYGETFNYSFAVGAGDADNGLFSIVDDKLVLNTPLDYESKPQLHVRIRTTDSTNRSFEKSFVINVRDVAETPVALPDTYNVPVNYFKDFNDARGDATSSLADNGVLANDSDGDGDTITAELVSPPLNGTLTFNADGTFRYRPHPLASQGQVEHFTYRVTDSTGLSSEATVTLNIGARIDSPFYNPNVHTDVFPGTSPGTTSSLDALAIINFLNAHRGQISIPVEELPQALPPAFYYDVNNDLVISSLDILAVFNYLNNHSRGGEGEFDTLVTTDSERRNLANLFDAAIVDLSELSDNRNSRRFAF